MGRELRVYTSPGWGWVGKVFGLRHAYVWSTKMGRGRGMNGSSGINGGDGVGDPIHDPFTVVDLGGRPEADVIYRLINYPGWEKGCWVGLGNDCHNQLGDAFRNAGLDFPQIPFGRFFGMDDLLWELFFHQKRGLDDVLLDIMRNIFSKKVHDRKCP